MPTPDEIDRVNEILSSSKIVVVDWELIHKENGSTKTARIPLLETGVPGLLIGPIPFSPFDGIVCFVHQATRTVLTNACCIYHGIKCAREMLAEHDWSKDHLDDLLPIQDQIKAKVEFYMASLG